jgi:hypothetical protein
MTTDIVSKVLDETIDALIDLDAVKLQMLEESIALVAKSNIKCQESEICAILAKQRLLELILQNSESTLNVLNRMHGRNAGEQWAL